MGKRRFFEWSRQYDGANRGIVFPTENHTATLTLLKGRSFNSRIMGKCQGLLERLTFSGCILDWIVEGLPRQTIFAV